MLYTVGIGLIRSLICLSIHRLSRSQSSLPGLLRQSMWLAATAVLRAKNFWPRKTGKLTVD